MSQHRSPSSEGHEINKFCRLFLGRHYFTISLADLCLGEEKKIPKEIIHFDYMTI